jgi:hypothetical protein
MMRADLTSESPPKKKRITVWILASAVAQAWIRVSAPGPSHRQGSEANVTASLDSDGDSATVTSDRDSQCQWDSDSEVRVVASHGGSLSGSADSEWARGPGSVRPEPFIRPMV